MQHLECSIFLVNAVDFDALMDSMTQFFERNAAIEAVCKISQEICQMPNINSAAKRLRQSIEARQRNQSVKSRVKNIRRKFLESFEVPEGADPQAIYRKYCSELDKAAKKGVISSNTASRRKTRAANRIRAKKS